MNIKKAFAANNGESLTDAIRRDCSGDYLTMLENLVAPDVDPNTIADRKQTGVQMQFLEVARGHVPRTALDSNDVFIFDTGFHVYAWIGKDASKAERKRGLQYAQYYIQKARKPVYTPVTRILEGGENEVFELCFDK